MLFKKGIGFLFKKREGIKIHSVRRRFILSSEVCFHLREEHGLKKNRDIFKWGEE